ncbi:restriction endonuclease subunit S [Epilithonimonas xixisoli]|uniref:Type I restriction enzyme S subunit n=1 Tax=Epilithonimonas xixisoli TaxID=1476462 RepID=A0A4R8I994_9FLAO|nr:restriction endonuclease subunit S [Epilithonimonas xixisoli]TDX86567.1 type I restriction enzyme S subunit [Epilithonimonas xixisoli]
MMEVKKIPEGWIETTLGNVINISSGKSRPKKQGLFPVYGGNGILDYADSYNYENATVIVGRVGAYCGCVYYEENKFWLSDNALGIKSNENSEIRFLYYFLLNENLNRIAIGGAQPLLTQGLLNQIEIIVPSDIKEQKSIAQILTSFDDKIELLQAQNKTLEALAQTVFKEWFGKYQVGDELPEGWKTAKINDFIEISLGGDYGKEDIEDEFDQKTLCLRGTDLPDMKMGTPEKAPIRFLKKSKLEKCKLINGDIVIEISGGTENQSTGRVMYINDIIIQNSKLPMTCVNFCRIIRPSKIEYTYFLYSLFDNLYNRRIFFNWENGTTGIKNLNLNAFLNGFELIIPADKNKIIKFDELVKSKFVKIQTNNIQIQTLTKTRDELLPKLMSGEIRLEEFKN